MGINWTVRLKNKTFWIALIPAAIVLVQAVAGAFGFALDLSDVQARLLDVVNAVFVLLAVLGIVADPTTQGVRDSEQAMGYEAPRSDASDATAEGEA